MGINQTIDFGLSYFILMAIFKWQLKAIIYIYSKWVFHGHYMKYSFNCFNGHYYNCVNNVYGLFDGH